MFNILIKNIGEDAGKLKIRDMNGLRRIARFTTKEDAEEAAQIVKLLRIDTAFQFARVIDEE